MYVDEQEQWEGLSSGEEAPSEQQQRQPRKDASPENDEKEWDAFIRKAPPQSRVERPRPLPGAAWGLPAQLFPEPRGIPGKVPMPPPSFAQAAQGAMEGRYAGAAGARAVAPAEAAAAVHAAPAAVAKAKAPPQAAAGKVAARSATAQVMAVPEQAHAPAAGQEVTAQQAPAAVAQQAE